MGQYFRLGIVVTVVALLALMTAIGDGIKGRRSRVSVPRQLLKPSSSAVSVTPVSRAPDVQSDDSRSSAEDADRLFEETVSKAIQYLQTGQAKNGSYSEDLGPGVTALVTTSILRHGRPADDPLVSRSLKYIEKFAKPDGGFYRDGTLYRNYETCLISLCLAEANDDGRYDELLRRADAFVKGIQWDDGEGKEISDPAYGGFGYGKHRRPDLSNASFAVETLRKLGNPADSDAIQRALIFISRCQNLESPHNLMPFATKNQDGGFIYTCAAGSSSQAGETPNGGLRSYGSMTYAGLKSMIYAGVGPDDRRVKAAVTWIKKHYGLETNPGLGYDGLYYYYHTLAKALDAMGEDEITDDQGRVHDWRVDLLKKLAESQNADGSWTNKSPRWLEGDANLVTGYALLALSYCRPKS